MIRKLLLALCLMLVTAAGHAGKLVDVIFPNPLNSNAYDGLIKIEVDAGTGEIRFIDLTDNKTLSDLASAGVVPLGVKDFHLDVGTGVDQISLDDIPAGILVPVFSEDNTMVYVGPNFSDSASVDFTYTPGSPGTVSADVILTGVGTSLATPSTLALRDVLGGFSVTAIRAPVVSSLTGVEIQLDEDNNGSNTFTVKNSAGVVVATFDESGFLSVLNTTVVTNLNADLLDGQTGSYYTDMGNANAGVLPVGFGGTGESNNGDAFDSLSPTTTRGDLVVRNATVNARLGLGTAGQVLTSDGLDAMWATPAGNPLTTQGDIMVHDGASSVRLPLGASGQYLRSDGTDTLWATPSFADFSGTLPVANGGTGLTAGTSGGILGYTAAGTLASSALLAQNQLMLGGGAGATPFTLGSLGTTTTVLHGNAAGAPTFGAVSLTADVSGTLPVANGGTGQSTQTAAFDALDPLTTKGDLVVHNGTNSIRQAVGTNEQYLVADSTQASGVRWQDPIGIIEGTATVTTSTSSASFVLITSMSVTPGTTGTYLCIFSASGSVSANGANVDYAIHNNGAEVTHSQRHLDYDGGAATGDYRSAMHSICTIVVTGGQTVDVRYRTSTGTISVYERTFEVIRIQ